MIGYATNGYLVDILESASADTKHVDHALANRLLTAFRDMESNFFENVHVYVDMGLAMKEVEISTSKGQVPNLFTVHGCRHIFDLISNLDKLAFGIMGTKNIDDNFNVHEAYILLCAAHIHDSGNMAGRDGHAERCSHTIRDNIQLFPETSMNTEIYDIACVHGGNHPEYEKDTFRQLDADNYTRPRVPLLAALLRIGDELSENSGRVPSALLDKFEASPLSKLAHAYAESFASFKFEKETLFITYNVYKKHHELIVSISENDDKKEIDVDFYDFLEGKINKIEQEARYCSQYGRPFFNVTDIKITINQYKEDVVSKRIKRKKLTLQLATGYPDSPTKTLAERCPELQDEGIEKLSEVFE